jgi:dipeptidyl aminopeptidase/acylaminoacyl peptidase
MPRLPGRNLFARSAAALAMAGAAGLSGLAQPQQPWAAADLLKIKMVGEVRISPNGTRIAYTVQSNNRTGRPTSQIWTWDRAAGTTARLGGDRDSGTNLRWSPDNQSLAFTGRVDDESGLMVQRLDGTSPALALARVLSTNHPLSGVGNLFTWSPGSSRIAFANGVPGPEGAEADGDPMVITRYLFKPGASEGLNRFNDNRRLQIQMADLVSHEPRPLTNDTYYNHSLDWSPKGDEVLFVSNREADPDKVFNYDVFAVNIARGSVRRITNTKSAEYSPAWSPDGTAIAMLATTRPLTSSETTIEDTHVWVMKADGTQRRELGAAIDNRQGPPQWSADGAWIYFTVQERGDVRLYRLPSAGGTPEVVAPPAGEHGSIGSWSVAKDGTVAFAMATAGGPSELYIREAGAAPRQLTGLNRDLLASRPVAPVESLTFKSVDGLDVEAFLTMPAGRAAGTTHPLIVAIHGGPHGQQGAAFNFKSQVYASKGWATLMVNYRGSTGYGQKFADAIAKDQNGNEARDVMAGIEAAIARYPWLDANRMVLEGGSYGGQLTNWLITQTDRFKAAIPTAGIANLVSFNYTAFYHDYLAVEFGAYPHEANVMDTLWERSPLRYVAKVKTPVLILHGENDSDVPISEAEQWYVALKDVGVDTVMVRYPREGHGLAEPRHLIDAIDRSIAWYERAFAPPKPPKPAPKK